MICSLCVMLLVAFYSPRATLCMYHVRGALYPQRSPKYGPTKPSCASAYAWHSSLSPPTNGASNVSAQWLVYDAHMRLCTFRYELARSMRSSGSPRMWKRQPCEQFQIPAQSPVLSSLSGTEGVNHPWRYSYPTNSFHSPEISAPAWALLSS